MIVLGVDEDDIVRRLLLDTSGRIVITGYEPSLFFPTPLSNRFSNTALPAGTSTQTAFTVPANSYYRLTGVSTIYTGTVAGVILTTRINISGTLLRVQFVSPPVSNVPNISFVNILMGSGWVLECVVTGATLNDDLFIDYFIERVK